MNAVQHVSKCNAVGFATTGRRTEQAARARSYRLAVEPKASTEFHNEKRREGALQCNRRSLINMGLATAGESLVQQHLFLLKLPLCVYSEKFGPIVVATRACQGV
jgi:hypothetical protein